eukprot:TRINITY_DN3852_c0_g1_i1.p1 TRINITY_DN3852_c0_g1~~TRINITY_DN3852_c0_g1_i1.p1  ORF type:complete len:705 (+),score=80.06 TRINITY_DN3852_c0_g1_i1:49-2163(+)
MTMADAELDSYELLASTIDLANKGVDASNVARLVEEQFSQKPHATTLDLGWNNLHEEGTAELVRVLLARPNKLRALDLWANGIGTEGAIALSRVLLSNTTLTSVNLRKNAIGTRGAIALLEAIRCNQHNRLEQLDVSMNHVQGSPEVVDVFSRPLANPTLATLGQLLQILKANDAEAHASATTVHQTSSRGLEAALVPTSAGSRYSSRSAGTRTLSDGSSERNIVSEDGEMHSGVSLCRSISLPLGVCTSSSRTTKAKLLRALEELQVTVSEQNTRIRTLEQSAPSESTLLSRDEQQLEERLMRRTSELLRKFCSFYMKRDAPASPDTAEDITFLELAGERIVNTDRTEREKPAPSVEVALYSVLLPEVQRLEGRLSLLEHSTEEKLDQLSQKQAALEDQLSQTIGGPLLEKRIADLEGRVQAIKVQLKSTKDSFHREVASLNSQLSDARYGKSNDKLSESTATPPTASKRKANVWWEDRYAENPSTAAMQQLLGESEETLSQARMQLVGLIGEVEHLRSPRRAPSDEQVYPNPPFKGGASFPRSKILPQFPPPPAVHSLGATHPPAAHAKQPQPVSPVTTNQKQAPRTVSALTPRSAAQVTLNSSLARKHPIMSPQTKPAAGSAVAAPRRQPSLTPVPANVTELQLSMGNQTQANTPTAAACPSPPAALPHSPSPPPYSGQPFSHLSITAKQSRRGGVPAANR